ncbi:MAG: alanine--tRNA ligase, partial [Bdellovibrio sp.]
SNEGRGYVLRRILRRAARFSQMLSGDDAFLPELAQLFIHQMQTVFPELGLRKEIILSHVELEQKRFLETLASGLQILDRELQKNSNRIISGEVAFKLYDSSGFPLDLTELIAAERGFQVDRAGFELQMQRARAQSQESWKGQTMSSHQAHLIAASQKLGPTTFVGHSQTSAAASLLFLSNGEREVSEIGSGESGYAIFSETPFYAESGGQVGDVGEIFQASALAQVVDVQKISGHSILSIKVINGPLRKNELCQQVVSSAERTRTAANHSATHLMHAALKKVLGPSVSQAGSLVDSQKTRFDFSFSRALSREEIRKIEQLVNDQIQVAQDIEVSNSSFKEAVAKGAVALFGEKYGEQVRVLKMGSFSTELCGGTHVKNTSEIRLFVIVSESGVSSGVRRIEAITGEMAFAWLKKQTEENLETRSLLHQSIPWDELSFQSSGPAQKIRELQNRIKDLEKENKKLQFQLLDSGSPEGSNSKSAGAIQDVIRLGSNEAQLLSLELASEDRELMAKKADQIRDQNAPSLIFILGSSSLAQRPVVLSASETLLSELSCGHLMQSLGKKFGGKGGGRPGFAQGSLPSSIGLSEIKAFLIAEISRRPEKLER